ncbi:hypothetical protein [Mycoplasmopsis felis]|uniref:hypothetical protein n=1 Tax=Mycoplasmopsis felis TaxID=33923 RepID=UPI002AFE3AFA|nr:hypothetical protein [Mycoplasmopsis felis]WQQ04717.1 hypothetical protein RRG55_04015 [Mycoplasmopsis felis]
MELENETVLLSNKTSEILALPNKLFVVVCVILKFSVIVFHLDSLANKYGIYY